MIEPRNFNALWAAAIAQELTRAGVQHVAIAPGSRSAQLALALAQQPELSARVILDERSAAFFALGAAKATRRPAAVLATSGSAGAHFYPAVLEAEAAGIPLVAITADRPAELHGFGAPQTCDQQRLFGDHVRAFADLGLPEPTDLALRHLRSVVTVCLSRALGWPRGPAHLNAPFREPLAPSAGPLPAGLSPAALDGPALELAAPSITYQQSGLFVSLARELATRSRGVIVCGPGDGDPALPAAIAALAEATGYPVLAEAASGVRGELPFALTAYDCFLRDARLASALRPDAIVRVGGGLTSKVLQAWLDGAGAFAVSIAAGAAPVDPSHTAARALLGPTAPSCHELAEAIRAVAPPPAARTQSAAAALAPALARAERTARAALDAAFAASDALSEPRIAREVVAALPRGAQLIVSSSMPVRDVDAFGGAAAGVRVLANRGLNGIDGIVSTALGAAASDRPTAVLLGDLALLHDLGGLVAAGRANLPLTIIAVDNDGGGIFHFLPVAEHAAPAEFERLFGTPHGLDLAHAAALAGARLHRPRTPAELNTITRDCIGRGLHFIHVRTDRAANVAQHRALQAAAVAALEAERWP